MRLFFHLEFKRYHRMEDADPRADLQTMNALVEEVTGDAQHEAKAREQFGESDSPVAPAPAAKRRVFIDIETYSEADLPAVGVYKYAEHHSTRIQLIQWAFDEEPVQLFDVSAMEEGQVFPEEVLAVVEAIRDPNVIKSAHNANFERVLFETVWGIECPPEEWECTQAQALSLALPPALDQLCVVLNLPEEHRKLSSGKRLIPLFCTPGPKGRIMGAQFPEKWNEFKEYAVQDVISSRECHKKMARWPLPPQEKEVWDLDQKINKRGLPLDMSLVAAALHLRELDEITSAARSKELTELENPNSRDQLLDYLRERGLELPDLKAATVRTVLTGDLPDDIREILTLRSGMAKSSIKKFSTLERAAGIEDRVRGCFQFAGAGRTWRWAGRLFQPQNLARGNLKDIETARSVVLMRDEGFAKMLYNDTAGLLSGLIRASIRAPEGKLLGAVDYVSIETVVLGWLANDETLLNVFRQGKDPYMDFATRWLGVEYAAVTKEQRNLSKPPALGCGFMLGAKGLVGYALNYGVTLTLEQAQVAVDAYRKTYAAIPKLWYALQDAVFNCVRTGKPERVGHIGIRMSKPFLMLDLPSGRSLAYLRPLIEEKMKPWGETGPTFTYYGREMNGKNYARISTHPGKITENVVQAVARDLLANGLRNAELAGFDIVGHVHDEAIVELPDDDQAEAQLKVLENTVSIMPDWCDAPVSAKGWVGKYYRKD